MNIAKGTLAAIGLVVVIIVIGLLSYYGGIFGNKVQANYQKRVVTSKIQQRVRTADFGQSAYEKFFNLCASVQSDEASLGAQYDLLVGAVGDDKTRIRTNIGALIAARADAINQYNAEGAEFTHGQFQDVNLPARLSNVTYEKGTHTTCAP